MSIQPFDAWSAVATGFKYLPHSLAVQAAVVAGAIAIGQVQWDVVKEAFFPSNSYLCDAVKDTPLLQKALMFVGVSNMASVGSGEEILFRGLLQDGLLTRVPKAVLGIFGKNHWVDFRPAQVVRVGISAAAFAAYHLVNLMHSPLEGVKFQIANTLGLGIVAAAIKERTGSVLPAMGLHGLYNALAMSIPNLWLATNACSIFKSDPPPSPFESDPANLPSDPTNLPSDPTNLPSDPTNLPSDPTNLSLDQNMCTMESIVRFPTCSSENNILAGDAASDKYMEEYHRVRQVEYNEKAESLLQLAQSPAVKQRLG